MNVNYFEETIELSEAFAKKAGTYGSKEYSVLKEAKDTHPSYKVRVVKASKSKNSTVVKGITRDFMYDYAKNHETEESLIEFALLKERNAKFLEVREKFFKYYPKFKELKNDFEWHLAARA